MTLPGALPPNVRVHSELPADYANFSVADARVLDALVRAEDSHFWFKSRNRLIGERLTALGVVPPQPFLELGCGGGVVAAHLARLGFQVVGVDGHLQRIRTAAHRAPEATFVVCDLSRDKPPLSRSSFAAVGLFDVIEHFADPVPVLAGALSWVQPGGFVVGTVPALQSLWSQSDVHAGHHRRYDDRSLREHLSTVQGASITELVHFNRHLVPAQWLGRRLFGSKDAGKDAEAGLAPPSAPVNAALLAVSALERTMEPVLSHLPLPGSSIWFALRRLPDPS